MTPLRQFKGVPTEVVRKAEGKQFVRHYGLQCEPQLMSSKQPWYRYFDLTPPEIGELIGIPNASRLVHCFVHNFPKLQYVVFFLLMWFLIVLALSGCKRQPITSTLLRIDLSIVPDFQWDEKIHGLAETFLILDEHNTQHNVTIPVPMFEPVPPNYYISVISDRWLHAKTRLPISFKHLILPKKFPKSTPLLDPLPLSALHNKEFEVIYVNSLQTFKIQTHGGPGQNTTREKNGGIGHLSQFNNSSLCSDPCYVQSNTCK